MMNGFLDEDEEIKIESDISTRCKSSIKQKKNAMDNDLEFLSASSSTSTNNGIEKHKILSNRDGIKSILINSLNFRQWKWFYKLIIQQ